jgi:hypothetical protein
MEFDMSNDDLIRRGDVLKMIADYTPGHLDQRAFSRAIAALPAVAPGVRVKPLAWIDFEGKGAKAPAWNEANYMIQLWSDGRYEISASYPGYSTFIEGTDRWYDTLDAAKAAAQADYEARILAAIDTPAPALMDELVEALRWYHTQMCEGFCEDLAERGTYHPDMDDQCAGCKARAVLAKIGGAAATMTHPLAADAAQALQGVTDLIARLKAATEGLRLVYDPGAVELIPSYTMEEAAAALTALSAEADALKAQVAELTAERNMAVSALEFEAKRSRRHLAASTLAILAAMTEGDTNG